MKKVLNLLLNKIAILCLVIFAVGIYAGISIIRFKPHLFYLNQIPKDQIEVTLLTEKVGKLMILPTDERPIIETITDLAPLKDKPFFVKAEVGDKVLIYEKAAKAILYRPSENIIINTVSPNFADAIFSMTSSSPVATPVPTPTPTPVPTPVPTPISTPTPVPSGEATLSPTPTPTPVPTLTPIPTPTPKAVTK